MAERNRKNLKPIHRKYGCLSTWDWPGNESKNVIVSLHGVYDSGRCWMAFAKRMPEEYRIVAFDQNAHGDTPLLDGDFSIDNMADQAVEAIKEMGAGQVVLIGHSMGGLVAHLTALKHPELLSCLVLDEPAWAVSKYARTANGFPQPLEARAMQLRKWTAGQILANGWEKIHDWDPLDAGSWLDAKLDVDTAFIDRANNWCSAATLDSLHDLPMPVMLLAGQEEKGSVISADLMDKACKALPSLVHYRLDTSHEVRKDMPDTYAGLVSSFIMKSC